MKKITLLIWYLIAGVVNSCLVVPDEFVPPGQTSRLLGRANYQQFFYEYNTVSNARDSLDRQEHLLRKELEVVQNENFRISDSLRRIAESLHALSGNKKRKDSIIAQLRDSVSAFDETILKLQKDSIACQNAKLNLDKQLGNYKQEIVRLKKAQSTNSEGKGAYLLEKTMAGGSLPGRISFRNQIFDTYVVDLNVQSIQLHWKNEDQVPYRNLGNLVTKLNQYSTVLMAVNAGIFKPDASPLGLYVEAGKELASTDLKNGSGNFYMKPNGVFYWSQSQASIKSSERYVKEKPKAEFATQSGPLLLENGNIHPAFNEGSKNLHYRNGVGILSDSKVVFVISNQPVNFYDFALFFKEQFGCRDALYLDGAISRMYFPVFHRTNLGGSLGPLISVTPKVER